MADETPPRGSDPTRFLATAEVPSDEVLTNLLGAQFLAYVCAAPVAEITARLERKASLATSRQEIVFAETLRAARLLAANRQPMTVNEMPALEPISEAFARFGQFIPDYGMSIANALRVQAGGVLEDIESGDSLHSSLARLALDWYPVLLIPEEQDPRLAGMPFAMRFSAFAWEHPAIEEFVRGLDRAEEPLRRLFPRGPIDRLTNSRPLMSSSGRGGSVQVGMLPSTLLSNGEMRARSRGGFELRTFLAEVTTQIDELRELSLGKSIRVPAVVGLGTVQVADDFRLETPWGVLLAASEWHRKQAPAQADLVLLTDFDLEVEFDVSVEPETYAGPPRTFLQAHVTLEHSIDMTRLMLLLGLEHEQPVALMATWRLIADPTTVSGFTWGPATPVPTPAQLVSADAPRLREWAQRIARHFDSSLTLAVRRTLASIAARHDPADGLVDAVIALENMFGTGQSEVGFRLSAALAWLLEHDPKRRLERQRDITKLYSLRSKIVHGSQFDATRLYPERLAASELAVNALRTLFRERPELIGAGGDRGRIVILQGAEPAPAENGSGSVTSTR